MKQSAAAVHAAAVRKRGPPERCEVLCISLDTAGCKRPFLYMAGCSSLPPLLCVSPGGRKRPCANKA